MTKFTNIPQNHRNPHKYTENVITKALVKGAPGHIMGFMFKYHTIQNGGVLSKTDVKGTNVPASGVN